MHIARSTHDPQEKRTPFLLGTSLTTTTWKWMSWFGRLNGYLEKGESFQETVSHTIQWEPVMVHNKPCNKVDNLQIYLHVSHSSRTENYPMMTLWLEGQGKDLGCFSLLDSIQYILIHKQYIYFSLESFQSLFSTNFAWNSARNCWNCICELLSMYNISVLGFFEALNPFMH